MKTSIGMGLEYNVHEGVFERAGKALALNDRFQKALVKLVLAGGAPVPHAALYETGIATTKNSLRAQMTTLRGRLKPLGLHVRAVHGTGYLAEESPQ